MFTSTFEQTVNESQLAKFASRMIAMDVAYENIGKKLTTTKIMALRVAHDILGRKQLNLISSMTKWRKF
jgi:F0F1-type ATP synthase gamma subunit